MATDYSLEGLRRSAMRDCHVHTPFYNHATGTMEAYVRAAIQKGLHEIGFLAHIEAGINSSLRTWLKNEDLETYWQAGHPSLNYEVVAGHGAVEPCFRNQYLWL